MELWPFLFVYTVYSYCLDDTISKGESIYRCSQLLRRQFIYKGFVNYFPIVTHRTVPLPPSVETKKACNVCFPQWVRCLPERVKNSLKLLGLITKKKRMVDTERRIGPRYMFICHPHGVISFGITGAMCWEGESEVSDTKIVNGNLIENEVDEVLSEYDSSTDSHFEMLEQFKESDILQRSVSKLKSSRSFKSLFPGINAHLLTLSAQLILPFYRDYIMSLGVGLVTKKSILSILKHWHSVTIVVGGAHESLLARPGMNRLVLNRRKGFVKIALESCNKSENDLKISKEELEANISAGKWNDSMSDIALVPIYVYGENNIYNVYNTTEQSQKEHKQHSHIFKALLQFQLYLKSYTGFTLPLVNSRSIFNYDFGLLPYRRRMDVVVGEPIYIYRKFGASVGDEVKDEEIEFFHELYKSKLMELWKRNKAFATEWDEDLTIVE